MIASGKKVLAGPERKKKGAKEEEKRKGVMPASAFSCSNRGGK